PGKGVLVIRARILRDGGFQPVTSGLDVALRLIPDRKGALFENDDHVRADVDLDGTLLLAYPPGFYPSSSTSLTPAPSWGDVHIAWKCVDGRVKAGKASLLREVLLAPCFNWRAP